MLPLTDKSLETDLALDATLQRMVLADEIKVEPWKDEELHDFQVSMLNASNVNSQMVNVPYCKAQAELYRLARLGLAAEKMGQRVVIDEVEFWSEKQRPIKVFLEHPAWNR